MSITEKTELRTLRVEEIVPYDKNPRRIPQSAVDGVADSIKRYGYQQPIVVDKDLVVIVGHTRLKAIQKLGYTEVQVYVADLPKDKADEYRLVDNRVGEMTSWDHETLVAELREFESDLLERYFPNVDLEIGQIESALKVTQKDVDNAAESIQKVNEGERLLSTKVKCPSCFFIFDVRTDSLPGLSYEDIETMKAEQDGNESAE